MFSKMRATKSAGTYLEQIEKLKKEFELADAIVIGAGAGLSASAGFVYNGERFRQSFSDFEIKYGFHDMYSGGFYPYRTQEEHWAYWSRYICINRYMDAPKPVYDRLFRLVKDKDYFVITTNVDHCFQKAGFDKKRLFYTQGDYEDLLPVCPHCGKPLTMNLRSDNKFVEDEGWHEAAERYELFIRRHRHMRVLLLELGVGYNTPGIIKYPFWQMTAENPKAIYACINYGEAHVPGEIAERSICINADIGEVLKQL